jgi:hypothetical protein
VVGAWSAQLAIGSESTFQETNLLRVLFEHSVQLVEQVDRVGFTREGETADKQETKQ